MGRGKYPWFGNTRKNQQDRSSKNCVCGGHNLTNVKKNKNHNSTKTRLAIKAERRFKRFQKWQ